MTVLAPTFAPTDNDNPGDEDDDDDVIGTMIDDNDAPIAADNEEVDDWLESPLLADDWPRSPTLADDWLGSPTLADRTDSEGTPPALRNVTVSCCGGALAAREGPVELFKYARKSSCVRYSAPPEVLLSGREITVGGMTGVLGGSGATIGVLTNNNLPPCVTGGIAVWLDVTPAGTLEVTKMILLAAGSTLTVLASEAAAAIDPGDPGTEISLVSPGDAPRLTANILVGVVDRLAGCTNM